VSISASDVRAWITRYAQDVAEHRTELVKLDTAIGDGDHGTNMDRGMRKAVERLDGLEGDDIGAVLKAVGMALVSSVGGAAGPLYGTLFLQMGTASSGREELDLAGWTDALEAGAKGVQARGKAEPGDKTMIDALLPAVAALAGELSRAAQRRAPGPRRDVYASSAERRDGDVRRTGVVSRPVGVNGK
jgi:dihydroxyacetone kinase-like protein